MLLLLTHARHEHCLRLLRDFDLSLLGSVFLLLLFINTFDVFLLAKLLRDKLKDLISVEVIFGWLGVTLAI